MWHRGTACVTLVTRSDITKTNRNPQVLVGRGPRMAAGTHSNGDAAGKNFKRIIFFTNSKHEYAHSVY